MNYYEILGVGPKATDQEIKEAYRREAMKWHPDRHNGAAAKGEADRRFKDLAVAYRTLRNPAVRADYDRQLEQQLRREYEARQQEQARQQRTQNEQAQRKQSRPEPPRQDFQDTKPQFDEETASADDANQMFYEQMLDLAFELAGRGFPEFNIYKALIALGCPDALAKSVAQLAANQIHDATGAEGSDKREESAISNFDEASFEDMVPYYAASIMGVEPISPISETRFQEILDLRKRRGQLFLILGVVVFLIGLFVSWVKKGDTADVILVALGIDLAIIILWTFSRSTFLGQDTRQFNAEEKKRYYLNIFRALHFKKVGGLKPQQFKPYKLNLSAFFALFGWLGYRRLPVPAFVGAVMLSAVVYAIDYFESISGKSVGGGLGIGVGFAFGTVANELYFKKVRSNILEAIDGTSKTQAIIRLRKKGGTNPVGWILPLVLYFVLLVPLVLIEDEKAAEKTKITQEQQAAQQAKAANAERQRVAEQQAKSEAELDQLIAQIQATHTELNEKSPTFDNAAVDQILARQKYYIDKGQTPINALKLAVADYDTALQQKNQLSKPNLKNESTPPLDRYIAFIKSLPPQDHFQRVYSDMGVKFPKILGALTVSTSDFARQHSQLARLVEETQTWSHSGSPSVNNGLIVFQNRTNQRLKGLVLEVQAEERGCTNKGRVYYMNLVFEKPVPSASVVGVLFSFPAYIQNANRCMDIVDLVFD